MVGSSGSGAWRSCAAATPAPALHATASTSRMTSLEYADAMQLRLRRLDPTVPLPLYGTSAAAGFDLTASRDVRVGPGQIALVPTGLVIEVPPGYFLGIFARSSTPL